MTRFAICTSVYESGRPYLAAWIDGVIKAAAGYSVTAIIAVDDFDAPEASFAPLLEVGEVTFAYTGSVCRRMFGPRCLPLQFKAKQK